MAANIRVRDRGAHAPSRAAVDAPVNRVFARHRAKASLRGRNREHAPVSPNDGDNFI